MLFLYNERVLEIICLKTGKVIGHQSVKLGFKITAMAATGAHLVIATDDKQMHCETLVDLLKP
jgi:hypothetical protein